MSIFSKVPYKKPGYNKFDLSHERKLTMNMGSLVPIACVDVVPGDKVRWRTEMFMRIAPLAAPMMQRVDCYLHLFYVPYRLLWNEFEDGISGGREGTANPIWPRFTINTASAADGKLAIGSLADYMGLPTVESGATVTQDISVSALPFRAYQLIYDEYYRDQNLQASLDVSLASGTVSGPELTKLLTLRNRAWRKDMFTSALPWPQRGPEVNIPIDGTADVTYKASSDVIRTATDNPPLDGTLTSNTGKVTISGQGYQRIENIEGIDLTDVAFTVNELRRSVRLQEWLEKMARSGARYTELIKSFFGVHSSDARLQRPEYLGGAVNPLVVSEVLSTFQTEEEGLPQGNMSGHGIAAGSDGTFRRFFEEHGIIMGVMSVMPKAAYQQGIPRMFRKLDRLDHYWPQFAHLGEQEIKLSELWYDHAASAGEGDETFGFTPRYAEYKYMPSSVHGDFRSSLLNWHQGRVFGSKPVLNESFIQAAPTQRVFAVEDPDVHKLYVQLYHRVDALRPMPYFGTPSL